tara:strand:- start:780 stop:2186 length:1407 start_codon:yes stop_codon:yes gene_type:complete
VKIRLILSFLTLVFLISITSCASSPETLEYTTEHVEKCPGEVVPTRLSVNCYYHKQGESSTAFAVIKSSKAEHDPILFLHGGPGGRSIADRYMWLTPQSKILNSNDLILIDQKGSGESKPSLDCWEVEEDLTEEAISACKTRLSLKGIDFSSYQIRGIAEDIVDLRNVLGIKKWNLYGVSFGSRIALELLAIDQAAVNSVVLDSPLPGHIAAYDSLPYESERAINFAIDNCQKIRECRLAISDQENSACSNTQKLMSECLGDLLLELKTNPIIFSTVGKSISIDDSTFALELVRSLAHPDGKEIVPKAVLLALNGRMAEAMNSLLTVDISGYSKGDKLSEGAQFSSECLDELPKNDPLIEKYSTPLASALSEREVVLQKICAIWNPGETLLKKPFPQSFKTEALILGGLLDPITPAAWSSKTQEILPNSILIQRENWTHAPSLNDECAKELVYKYFTGKRWSHGREPC